jgi:2-methylisocitrate lyase-like PEP mutase family enzyme
MRREANSLSQREEEMTTPAKQLSRLLASTKCHIMPCCWDALSARLIEQAGYDFTFMSGFAVSAARTAEPDAGLISFGEMIDQGRNICSAVTIPVIGDGDTGYGNALNVRRTVAHYAKAGFAAVMIEDQLSPKRCGHVQGKQVVERAEALMRIRAAVDQREAGSEILVVARTDARGPLGFDEALWRAKAFADLGADILFVEAPQSEMELAAIPEKVRGLHMANMISGGTTPVVPPQRLESMGYRIAAYPLAALGAAIGAIRKALSELRDNEGQSDGLAFADIKRIVGFDDYHALEARYGDGRREGQ